MAFTVAAAVLVVVALLGGIVHGDGSPPRRPRRPSTDRTRRRSDRDRGDRRRRGAAHREGSGDRAGVRGDRERHGCLRGHRGRRRPSSDRPARLRRTPVRQDGRQAAVSTFPRCCRCRPTAPSSSTPGTSPSCPRAGMSAEPGEGWVESGARLLDLTTGAIDTYPSGPDSPGVIDPAGQVELELPVVARQPPGGVLRGDHGRPWAGGCSEALPGRVLDTTQKMRGARGPRPTLAGSPRCAAEPPLLP